VPEQAQMPLFIGVKNHVLHAGIIQSALDQIGSNPENLRICCMAE
jgi:hypothetical protein